MRTVFWLLGKKAHSSAPDLMPCLVFALFSIELLKSVLTGNQLSPSEMIFDMKVSWSWVYFRVFGLSSLVYISITRFQVCLVFVLLLVFVPVIEFSLVLCALLLVLLPASCFPWFSSPMLVLPSSSTPIIPLLCKYISRLPLCLCQSVTSLSSHVFQLLDTRFTSHLRFALVPHLVFSPPL